MFDLNLSVLEAVFLGCAMVGGGLFVLRSVMMLTGLGGEDDGAGVDVSESHGEPTADFKMVTIHGLTSFLMMFGVVGFLLLHNDQVSPWVAGVVAALAGGVTMFVIAKIFHSSRRLVSDGTIYLKDAIGGVGSVYLTIRPGEVGKVQLTVRDTLKIFDARARDVAAEIKTGERVKVVESRDTLIVEPA